MVEDGGRVEREVGQGDHRHGIGADLLRVRRELDGIGRGLRAGVHRDQEPVRAGLEETFGRASAFVDREGHALAGRSAGGEAVGAAAREEADERAERLLVQAPPAVGERRDRVP